ncbi:MAG: YeeE/YedE family protein, partial [Candidatus Kapaibacteriota bacterium]
MKWNWKMWFGIFLIITIIPFIVALQTNYWWVGALSVGILFGFALQKGDLCGSSAMSEIILFRDKSKIFGLWVAIVSSMFFFAILNLFGLVELAPKKFIWANSLVGGFIFGIGTVLGGGCISGCLYKSASGNLNSMVALLTIPLGISAVDYGILKSFHESLLKLSTPEALTLYSVLKLPYWLLVLIFIILTLALSLTKRKEQRDKSNRSEKSNLHSLITRPWRPWQAGIMIGFVGMLAWLSSLPTGRNYPLG